MQTQTRRWLLIWTLFSATLKLMVWKMRKLKAYVCRSLTTFCQNLFERKEEKWRKIRASDSFQFSAQLKLTALLRRIIHLTYPRTGSSKNPEVLTAKRKSLVLTRAQQRKQTACCSGHRWRRRGCFFLVLNWATAIQLRFKELCGDFYTTLRSLNKRNYQSSDPLLSSSAPVFTGANIGSIHQQVHIPIISLLCENCPEWKKASNCYRQQWGRLTLKLFSFSLSTMSSFELAFTALNLDFHWTLTWSIFGNQESIVRSTKNPFSTFRINNCFCQIPLQSIFWSFV